MVCWGKNEVWVCGYSNIFIWIDINGKINEYIGDIGMYFFFYDIVVIVYGDLIYIDGRKGKMKIIGYDDFLVSIFLIDLYYIDCVVVN